jgi:putative oxidoreductase
MTVTLISSLLINLLYYTSAYGKINNLTGTAKGLKNIFWIKGLPLSFFQFTIFCVIILLIVAPSIILLASINKKYNLYAKLSCYALIAFTILATLLYHFPTDPSQRINFMKNLSIIGGFLALSLQF